EVQARTQELTESLERQTATSEVLGVISRSKFEIQPVLDAIVQTAKRLCQAERAAIWRLRDGRFDLAAQTMTDAAIVKYLRENPIPVGHASLAGRAALERRPIHTHDIAADPELGSQPQARAENLHTMLTVPLLRDGEPLGVLALARSEVRPFADKQVELVTTFADQAVIAIENVRLFEEVQARTRAATQALLRQTATTNVLRVIASSPTNVQPVLQTVADNAARLCGATQVIVYRLEEGGLVAAADFGAMHRRVVEERAVMPISRGWATGRA